MRKALTTKNRQHYDARSYARTRRTFSAETMRLAWRRAAGVCECGCGVELVAPHIVFDHRVPWEMSRDSTLANCQVLRSDCDHRKTYGHDIPMIRKADRVRDFHLGIRGPGKGAGPKLPCGTESPRTKTFSHGIVPRRTASEKHRALMRDLYGEDA